MAPVPENLLTASTIWLFGRPVEDLALKATKYTSGNGVLAGSVGAKDAMIARVYAFAYQNELFELAAPALFVVRGKGDKVDATVGLTGLASVSGRFAGDLVVWAHDREDFTVRLDVMTGSFDRVLLVHELAEDGLQDFVRGTAGVGLPSNLGPTRRPRRGRRWRADDD